MPAARPALLAAAFAAGLNCTPQPALRPSVDPARLDPWSPVTHYLDSAIAAGAAPGAVLGVSYRGRRFVYGTGRLGTEDPTRPDSATVYDLASLTKVIGLTTMVMLAVDEGRLDLDAPVQQYVPAFRGTNKPLVTLRHLLTHSSGLPAWRPLYQETATRAAALALADTTPLDTLPGARYLYSDLGAIVLTQAVEAVYGTRLDSLLADRVFGPLDMNSTRYLPPASWLPRIAPTENDPWRGRVVRGEVHDENAYRLGGVSGHAGLFSTAPDLLRFGEWLLLADHRTGGPAAGSTPVMPATIASLHGETVREFLRRQNLPPGSSRALGWDTPSPNSSAGTRLSDASFGHTGFTGTSIWIDPEQDLVIVLLTNRVNPTRENRKIYAVRRGVADRVVEEVESQK
ncbi:MAG: serine hydrolase domain-containing protein [Gemmatimonadales bacterium]